VNVRLIKISLLGASLILVIFVAGIFSIGRSSSPDLIATNSPPSNETSLIEPHRSELPQQENPTPVPKKPPPPGWPHRQENAHGESLELWAVQLADSGASYHQIEQKLVEREGKDALISFRWKARKLLEAYFDFPPFWEEGTFEIPVLPTNLSKEITQHIVNQEWGEIKAHIVDGTLPINSRLQETRPTTVFMQAILSGDEDLVGWFLAHGVNPLGIDLRTAIIHGHNSIAMKLARTGSDIHHQTVPDLSNNFLVAILRNNLEMAEFLRRSGVSIRPDPLGYDALELSLKRGQPTNETIDYLRSLGFDSPEIRDTRND
jgi:hypothetical protein